MDSNQVKAALEQVVSLIRHQYTGSQEAMTALQIASDDCADALASLQPGQEPVDLNENEQYRMQMAGISTAVPMPKEG